jgi:hypothetical protein
LVHLRDQAKIDHVLLASGQELSTSFAGVQVPDPGGEKLEELGRGIFTGVGED